MRCPIGNVAMWLILRYADRSPLTEYSTLVGLLLDEVVVKKLDNAVEN